MRIIRSSPTSSPSLREAALQYAEDGYRVLPCIRGSKQPAIEGWPTRATSDQEVVARWWNQDPCYNVGILTGAPGPDVLDIDVTEAATGFAYLDKLRRRGKLDGAIRRVRTPSGGEHWWFPGTTRRKTKPAPFVDFQAGGAFVLAPPSVLILDGEAKAYELISEWNGPGAPLRWEPEVPGHAARRPRRSQPSRSAQRPIRWLAEAPTGQRNDRLFRAACWLIRQGEDPWQLRSTARSLGLHPDEVEATIRSATRNQGGAR